MHVDINTRVLAKVLPAVALMLLFASTVAESVQDEPYRVLVVHSFRNSLPVNTDWYDGIVRGFSSAHDLRVEIDIEAPDLTRFGDADYVTDLLEIYHRKYRDHKPHLIIPTYTPALQLLLDHGDDLFPGTPIVFCGADDRFVAARKLAAHITGITSHRDIAGTLELALHVHPDTQRVAVIVGSAKIDKQFERDAREAFQPFGGRVEFLWLKGMPMGDLAEAVSNLPAQTVILYLTQFQDRTGKSYVPVNTTRQLATVANAPIYGLWDTLLEHGIIGGRLATLEDDGFQAAQMGLRILRGEAPATVPVIDRDGNDAIFHGGELARWNIDEDRLPEGSRILHRPPSLWADHRKTIMAGGVVVGIQGFLILALLLNRAKLKRAKTELLDECERRTRAETVTGHLRGRLARFSSERTLGALATTIAHEINQPLIAIQNYAQAAKRRAQSPVDQKPKLDELFKKIEQQAGRAGDIIQRIRALVGTADAELHAVVLYPVVEQVIQIVGSEFESQRCIIDFRPAADLPPVLADVLQIQLVLVNLLRNGLHSMASSGERAGKGISVEIRRINDREEQVSVADRGPGVAPDRVESLFEPFEFDSREGMGIGLAICRTIIEAHGGRIWHTANPSGGAIFHFTLPLAGR